MSDQLRLAPEGRSDLADLEPYRAPQLEAAVKLNTNESPYPPPDEFTRELQERIGGLSLNRYPVRDFSEVREGLAAHLGTLTDRVWLANGSNEIILQLLLGFGGAERKVMTFEPTYGMHGQITKISGTRHLRARRNPDFTMHPEASIEAIQLHQPDVVFLCSPNNPTGNAHTAEEVKAVCAATPALVVLDEAYAEFSAHNHLRLIEELENLVITRSFSKSWRLAGARIGYLVGQPRIIEQIQKVRLPYHLSTLSQAVVLTALNHVDAMLGPIETIKHEREKVYRELSTTRGITAFPSEANFIMFRTTTRPAAEVWRALLDGGILVRDFSELPGCESCLRVSIGTPVENERFLERLSLLLLNPGMGVGPEEN